MFSKLESRQELLTAALTRVLRMAVVICPVRPIPIPTARPWVIPVQKGVVLLCLRRRIVVRRVVIALLTWEKTVIALGPGPIVMTRNVK